MDKMRKALKSFLVVGVFAGLLLAAVPVAANSNNTNQITGTEKIKELTAKKQEASQGDSYDEKEYKNLSAELGKTELEYKKFDYQEEVDLRLNTLQISLEDIAGEIEREEDGEQKSNLKARYKKLDSVYQKYRDIVDNVKDESEYEEIAGSLNEDLEAVYKELNG